MAGLLAADGRGGGTAAGEPHAPLSAPPPPPLADVAAAVGGVRGAGALFPGQQLERASKARCATWTLTVLLPGVAAWSHAGCGKPERKLATGGWVGVPPSQPSGWRPRQAAGLTCAGHVGC